MPINPLNLQFQVVGSTSTMDRSWLRKPRLSAEYRGGINFFLDYIKEKFPNRDMVVCPCSACCNARLRTLREIEEHLVCKGFVHGYEVWFCHGELDSPYSTGGLYDEGFDSPPQTLPTDQNNPNQGDDMQGLIEDA